MINLGDKVEKVGGDYAFVGFVVAKFNKVGAVSAMTGGPLFSGALRFVVEDDRGILHIYSEKNLRKI